MDESWEGRQKGGAHVLEAVFIGGGIGECYAPGDSLSRRRRLRSRDSDDGWNVVLQDVPGADRRSWNLITQSEKREKKVPPKQDWMRCRTEHILTFGWAQLKLYACVFIAIFSIRLMSNT